MNTVVDPILSEFETSEQALTHDQWFRAQVLAAMQDDLPRVEHDVVMAEMDAIIARAATYAN